MLDKLEDPGAFRATLPYSSPICSGRRGTLLKLKNGRTLNGTRNLSERQTHSKDGYGDFAIFPIGSALSEALIAGNRHQAALTDFAQFALAEKDLDRVLRAGCRAARRPSEGGCRGRIATLLRQMARECRVLWRGTGSRRLASLQVKTIRSMTRTQLFRVPILVPGEDLWRLTGYSRQPRESHPEGDAEFFNASRHSRCRHRAQPRRSRIRTCPNHGRSPPTSPRVNSSPI